ncbi:hypothetical protein SERLA73DRAFT_186176 [Serpula lacrymans var. lacrymans S7.3]|uniref:Uncharacterized protein n=1 Tax=Serpula lacrymans var. lacrymans (strain S7.3) TaxID=936435 RepID=F8Q5H2_SERL3|nr:hypothetical protein SERLA73DRAFT_186176 [Serpula lacrymans var. lacrymans S7.3]
MRVSVAGVGESDLKPSDMRPSLEMWRLRLGLFLGSGPGGENFGCDNTETLVGSANRSWTSFSSSEMAAGSSGGCASRCIPTSST